MSGTSGGQAGTNGARRRIGLAGAAAVALVIGTVNAASTAHDTAGKVAAWEPWVWEYSSVAFWVMALWPLWRVSRRLQPPRLGWPATIAAWLGISVIVSALHIAWLAAVRPPVYVLLGSRYAADWSWAQIVYEYRKDLMVTLMLIGVGVVVDLWARAAEPVPPAEPPYRLEIRDGARTQWFAPHEIERVEAAGNYVEVHGPRGPVLHRATLTTVEGELGAHGFARIHRSRLVRRDAVTAVTSTPAGDFEVRLSSGAVVAGSRRFRIDIA